MGYTAFFQKARFYPNQKESVGGKFYFKVGESGIVGVNYTSRNVMYRDQQFWSHLAGLSGNFRTKEIQLETELAAGKAGDKKDIGAYVRLLVTRKWFNAASTFIYAGKNFYGFYNNSLLVYNNIGVNITSKLAVGVTTNFSNLNPSLDANFYSVSPKDRSYSIFTSYQPDRKNRLFLYYSLQERQDRQKPASFHYSENFGNLSYNYTAERFTLFYQGRYGYSRNYQAFDSDGRKQSFSNIIQPSVRTLSWMWVGGYFEHMHTSKFSSANVVEDLLYYGGNARISMKRGFHATLMYRNNYAPDELYIRRSFMDASVALDLRRHHFSLTGGRSFLPNAQNTNQNALFFNARYALKLNVPVARKKNIGRVRGRISGTGFSKQGHLVQLGNHQFMTDSTGTFSFDGIAPDQYYLSIVQNESRNEGVVPAVKIPMFVHVKTDSVRVIDIPFTRTGHVVGKVEYVQPGKSSVSAILQEKPVVLVRISDGNTSMLTEPNENGEFSFKEIKPGSWLITAFIPGEQDRFVIEEGNKNLDLEKDKTLEVLFRVRPNEKRIHFSEKNFDVSIKK